jgi:hypothetical protein
MASIWMLIYFLVLPVLLVASLSSFVDTVSDIAHIQAPVTVPIGFKTRLSRRMQDQEMVPLSRRPTSSRPHSSNSPYTPPLSRSSSLDLGSHVESPESLETSPPQAVPESRTISMCAALKRFSNRVRAAIWEGLSELEQREVDQVCCKVTSGCFIASIGAVAGFYDHPKLGLGMTGVAGAMYVSAVRDFRKTFLGFIESRRQATPHHSPVKRRRSLEDRRAGQRRHRIGAF